MKQVKELSLVQSVSADNNCLDDLANCGYAIGFASTDFIIWNLISEAKVVSLSQVFIPSCVHDQTFVLFLLMLGAGCANSMWWMATSSFLLSW